MEFPPLESVEQFPAIQGQKAIDRLLDIINNGNEPEEQAYYKITIESELIMHSDHWKLKRSPH